MGSTLKRDNPKTGCEEKIMGVGILADGVLGRQWTQIQPWGKARIEKKRLFCGREESGIIVGKTDTNFAKANCVETPSRPPGRLLGQHGEDRAESEGDCLNTSGGGDCWRRKNGWEKMAKDEILKACSDITEQRPRTEPQGTLWVGVSFVA